MALHTVDDGFHPSDEDAPPEDDSLLFMHLNSKGYPVKDHVANTKELLRYHRVQVRYNLMTHDLEVTVPGRDVASERRSNLSVDWVENRAAEFGMARAPIIKHLQELAREYHPVRDWVERVPWDGRDRVPELLATIELADTADFELSALLLRRWLRGAAAGLWPEFEQNFAAQGVLVFLGEQGRGKTRWLQSLVRDPTWVLAGETLDPGSRDSTQRATSVWLCELGEVDATFRRADIAALKSFVTKTVDTFRSAYARREERNVRRTVFFASVNDEQFLVDRTGNRRWWTVPVVRCDPHHTVDVQQLWAQMLYEVVVDHAPWWLNEEEVAWLNRSNRRFEQEDVLPSLLLEHWIPLKTHEDTFGEFEWRPLSEVCASLPQFAQRVPTPAELRRVTDALRELGPLKKRDKYGMRYALRTIQG